jgi:hypothetical protein
VIGGDNEPDADATAELYDITSGHSRLLGNLLPEMRFDVHAVFVSPGRALVVAQGRAMIVDAAGNQTTTLDAQSGLRTIGALDSQAPWPARPVTLKDGKILLTGGCCDEGGSASNRTALYDPVTNSLSALTDLHDRRIGHTATALSDGRVVIAGGKPGRSESLNRPMSDVEIFDPATQSFTSAQPLARAWADQVAIDVGTGDLLMVGNADTAFEIYRIH